MSLSHPTHGDAAPGQSGAANTSITAIKRSLREALDELTRLSSSSVAPRVFTRMTARWLAPAQGDATPTSDWSRYVHGAKTISDASVARTIDTLPKQGTFGEITRGASVTVQHKLQDVLYDAGRSTDDAMKLLLEELRMSMSSSVAPSAPPRRTTQMTFGLTGPSIENANRLYDMNPYAGGAVKPFGWTQQEMPQAFEALPDALAPAAEAKGDVPALDRAITQLRALLDVAREYAVHVVTLIEQYLDWLVIARNRAVERLQHEAREAAVSYVFDQIDRDQLRRNIGALPVWLALVGEGRERGERVGYSLLPAFRHPELNQSVQTMFERLLTRRGSESPGDSPLSAVSSGRI